MGGPMRGKVSYIHGWPVAGRGSVPRHARGLSTRYAHRKYRQYVTLAAFPDRDSLSRYSRRGEVGGASSAMRGAYGRRGQTEHWAYGRCTCTYRDGTYRSGTSSRCTSGDGTLGGEHTPIVHSVIVHPARSTCFATGTCCTVHGPMYCAFITSTQLVLARIDLLIKLCLP